MSDYKISVLTDMGRLSEVNKLNHDTFIEVGAIQARPSGEFNLFPHLDNIAETTIIIAEVDGVIIGTCSITLDGDKGLASDMLFKQATDNFREKTASILASNWRLATNKHYRNNPALIMDIIKTAGDIAKSFGAKNVLCILKKQHGKFYKKLFQGQTIAETTVTSEDKKNTKAAVLIAIPT